MSATAACASALGPIWLAASDHGVTEVRLGDEPPRFPAAHHERPTPGGARIAEEAAAQLRAYTAGEITVLAVPLDWRWVSGFRRQVLEALTRVARGEVVTYGELAAAVRRPGAARAVGGAVAANPWPLLVPCHRVVAAGGRLGGYSGGQGVVTKRRLLVLEGVEVDGQGRVRGALSARAAR